MATTIECHHDLPLIRKTKKTMVTNTIGKKAGL
jgi:hypothetical protein